MVLVVGYLIGSLSFGVMIGRYYGIDLFKVGSCNPGATNVKRMIGKVPGNVCFVLDCLKGLAAVVWVQWFFSDSSIFPWLASLSLLAAVLGHRFSLLIGFRGGKGVATTIGGVLGIMPYVTLLGVGLWVIVFFGLRYVSLASLAFAVSLPLGAFLFQNSISYLLLASVLALIIVLSHSSNIRRLLQGKEHRFTTMNQPCESTGNGVVPKS